MSSRNARARENDPAAQADAALMKRLTPQQRAYIVAYGLCGGVQIRAAKAAKITPRAAQRWAKDSADFREALDAAEEVAASVLEEEARRRAIDGVRRPVLYKGKPVKDPENPDQYLYEHEYSDRLLIEMLRAHHPRYRQMMRHEIRSGGDVPDGDADKGLETLRQIIAEQGNGHPHGNAG